LPNAAGKPSAMASFAQLAAGDALEEDGDLVGALACYSTATTVDPDDVEGWTSRGAAEAALGRGADAAASLQRALDAEPEDADLHASRGAALCQVGDVAAAAECHGMGLALSADYFAEAGPASGGGRGRG